VRTIEPEVFGRALIGLAIAEDQDRVVIAHSLVALSFVNPIQDQSARGNTRCRVQRLSLVVFITRRLTDTFNDAIWALKQVNNDCLPCLWYFCRALWWLAGLFLCWGHEPEVLLIILVFELPEVVSLDLLDLNIVFFHFVAHLVRDLMQG